MKLTNLKITPKLGILVGVTLLGLCVAGLLAGYLALRTGISQNVRLLLTTGLLGGFTTFSAFSLDSALMIERHEYWSAAAYVAASVGLGLAGLFIGLALMRQVAQLP